MQLCVAATPCGLAQMSKKVVNLHSVCSALPALFCGYQVSSLVGILIGVGDASGHAMEVSI